MAASLSAQSTPTVPAETLLDRAVLKALDEELSGVAAKDHVSRLAQLHRVPASPGFHQAIEYVMERARAAGLSDVHVESFPGDGTTWFGTLHANRGWRVDAGWLDEVQPQPRRIISSDDVRLAVADNSESADVTVELVDVGAGTERSDYAGKDVRGKLVLCDATPSACHRQAVEELGAAGLVSYNSNQVSAWWRDDQDLIRWGHLDSRGRRNAFAIMISVREARALQQRLARGERITLHAVVRARNDDGQGYETLIDAKRIPAPVRTIRFIWPSEMTGTIAYLSKYPEIASRIRAAVHLDMVGADPFITKSVLHVTRSPWSIATVTDDVAETFGRYVIDGAMRAAGEGDMTRAIRARGGSKDAFWADITPYESGSDHWIYQEGGFAIPSIYLRDHPDIYIHTTGDLPDNIEPTKIKRSAFIAAASGYYLATMPDRGAALLRLSYANAYGRLAEDGRRAAAMAAAGRAAEAVNIIAHALGREQRRLQTLSTFVLPGAPAPSIESLGPLADRLRAAGTALTQAIAGGPSSATAGGAPTADARIPMRNPAVKGPLPPDGDWVVDKAGRGGAVAISRVPRRDDVTYEIVNFIDGSRSIADIRNAVSAEFEPIELAAVAEYIELLARAGAITFKR